MCTLTLVPLPDSPRSAFARCRIVCNRDEQRSRPQSLPPRCVIAGAGRAVYPVDPPSGGTWIGANNAGVVACLINASAPAWAAPRPPAPSRGTIVPSLLAAGSLTNAIEAALALDVAALPPFRLCLYADGRLALFSSSGAALRLDAFDALGEPLVLASSGLGDHLVVAPRRQVFQHLLESTADPLDAQSAFHAFHDPDAPALSPLMARADARTVSRTLVDVRRTSIRLSHVLLDDRLAPVGSPCQFDLPRTELAVESTA